MLAAPHYHSIGVQVGQDNHSEEGPIPVADFYELHFYHVLQYIRVYFNVNSIGLLE